MSGAEFVMHRKLTLNINLTEVVEEGLDRFLTQSAALQGDLEELQWRPLHDLAAKAKVFDLFNERVLPIHLFDDVSALYFTPPEEYEDCQPRSEWGLHNSCTRAIQALKPMSQLTAAQALGRSFGLATTPMS